MLFANNNTVIDKVSTTVSNSKRDFFGKGDAVLGAGSFSVQRFPVAANTTTTAEAHTHLIHIPLRNF